MLDTVAGTFMYILLHLTIRTTEGNAIAPIFSDEKSSLQHDS